MTDNEMYQQQRLCNERAERLEAYRKRVEALEAELAEARKDGERWEHRYRCLRKLAEAALPENMGGYPDLFYPEGFHGDNDSANPWEWWESAVKIEAKYVDAAVAERDDFILTDMARMDRIERAITNEGLYVWPRWMPLSCDPDCQWAWYSADEMHGPFETMREALDAYFRGAK